MSDESVTVSARTAKRLADDIRDIIRNPLNTEGIYYEHDPEHMLRGYAMIVGPEGTVYEGGYYLFSLDFPPTYPEAPPKATYWTNDGVTRFNPNLYKNGKVCISLLNTWKGEQWTSCQSLRSVLLNLCMLLVDNPLLNEPGVGASHPDVTPYREIIRYKNIEWAILKQVNSLIGDGGSPVFSKELEERFGLVIRQLFVSSYESTRSRILKSIDAYNTKGGKAYTPYYKVRAYSGMSLHADYHLLLARLDEIYKMCIAEQTALSGGGSE